VESLAEWAIGLLGRPARVGCVALWGVVSCVWGGGFWKVGRPATFRCGGGERKLPAAGEWWAEAVGGVVEADGGGRSVGRRLGFRVSGWWRRRSPAATMTAAVVELGLEFGGPGL
jgi:hypothetical protein